MFALRCRAAAPLFARRLSVAPTTKTSERAQMKRMLRKQKRVPPPSTEYTDNIVFPREGHGLDYALNWSVNAYSITPTNLCFHNLHPRELMARAQGRATSNKALHVSAAPSGYKTLFVGRDISLDAYRRLSMHVRREHLTDADTLYVHDCTVGATRDTAAGMRLITNDAATALYASHMFSRAVVTDYDDFEHPFTAFVAPDMVLEDPAAYGLENERVLLINAERGTMVGVGVPPTALGEAVSTIAGRRLVAPYLASIQAKEQVEASNKAAQEAAKSAGTEAPEPEVVPKVTPLNGIPLDADAIQYGDNSVLLFGTSDAMRIGGLRRYLAGAGVNVWHDGGVTPVFSGMTLEGLPSKSTQRADLIVEAGKNSSTTTTNPLTSSHALNSPQAVILLVDDADLPAKAELDATKAVKTILSGYRGKSTFDGVQSVLPDTPWGPVAMRLEELFSKNKTAAYVINVNGLKESAFEKNMLDVFNGSFSAGKTDSTNFWKKAGKKIDDFLKKQ